MLHGTYIGMAHTELAGEKALIRLTKDPAIVLAQFDNLALIMLAFDWHEFPATDFKLDNENASSIK